MLKSIDNAIRQLLGEHISWKVRYYSWKVLYFWPRQIGSLFINHPPLVTTFRGCTEPEFVKLIRSTNTYEPTSLCKLMTLFGSDKGRRRHNYTTVYYALFEGMRAVPLRIFELGLGSTNPAFQFSMGIYGRPGASLRGWRAFFPRAEVFGADIDRDALFNESGIQTYFCDQLDPASIREMWAEPSLRMGMDIIIEDGLHTLEANMNFLENSVDLVRSGGFYIIEDIAKSCIDRWKNQICSVYLEKYPDCKFALVQLPNAFNDIDNNMLIVNKKRS